MLRLAVLALVGAVSAVGAAQAVASFNATSRAAAITLTEPATAAAQGEATSIAKSRDGHYWAEADVNGSRVRFLVDTGASAVALTAADAQRLGYDPAR